MTTSVQARGSATRLLLDHEDTFKTSRTGSDRKPVQLTFTSVNLNGERALQQSEVINGDRNPDEPVQGNVTVSGSISVPVNAETFPIFAQLAMGEADEFYLTGGDRKTGTPTVSISSGEATFSTGQTSAAVGDLVYIRESDGTITSFFLTAETSDTVWTVAVDPVDGAAPSDTTAATVLSICQNYVDDASADTGDISGGALTFDQTQAGATAGRLVRYLDDDGYGAILVADQGSDVWTVRTVSGQDPADDAATEIWFIGEPLAVHKWIIHPTNEIPSFMVEVGHTDLNAPYYIQYNGCKVGSIEFSFSAGESADLVATINIEGAKVTRSYLPYEGTNKLTGSPTISGTGANQITFSSSQTLAVGDYVVWKANDGRIVRATLTSGGSNTAFTTSETVPSTAAGSTVYAAYDPTAGTVFDPVNTKFQPNEAAVSFDPDTSSGTASFADFDWMTSATLTFDNSLDTDQFAMGSNGERIAIPSGNAGVSGELSAFFADNKIKVAADERATAGLRFQTTSQADSDKYLRLDVTECQVMETEPAVDGDGGIMYSPSFMGYKKNGESALIITASGAWCGYAEML